MALGAGAARADVVSGLSGLGLRTSFSPGDTTGAPGTTHFVEMVNGAIGVYSRTDLSPVVSQRLTHFVAIPGSSVFDVQIEFDRASNRWLYAADAVVKSPAQNFLAYGWSKTADPSDLDNGWCKFKIDSSTNGLLFDDYPRLGFDDARVYIGSNAQERTQEGADDSSGNRGGERVWTFPKPAPGDTSCTEPQQVEHHDKLRAPDGTRATRPQPTLVLDASTQGHVISIPRAPGSGSENRIFQWHVADDGNGGTQMVYDGAYAVDPFTQPGQAPQPGGAPPFAGNGTRPSQAIQYGDSIWTTHTVGTADGRSVARWYQLRFGSCDGTNCLGGVVQQGTIDPGGNRSVLEPAISPTLDGGAAIVYNVTGPDDSLSLRASMRSATDPPGTMPRDVLLSAGTNPVTNASLCGSGSCRWGDYSGIFPDPLRPGTVWGTGMLAAEPQARRAWHSLNFALDVGPASFQPVLRGKNPKRIAKLLHGGLRVKVDPGSGLCTAQLSFTTMVGSGSTGITRRFGSAPCGESRLFQPRPNLRRRLRRAKKASTTVTAVVRGAGGDTLELTRTFKLKR